jgi:isopentenyldiphosphate isomerase
MGEQEKLKIFDDNKKLIGIASRSDVHRIGYWHEAFHCWFISNEQGINYIYLQLRSKYKKDYPNLLDITAAGHLLADETVEDGVREIKEEIGIEVNFKELIKLGVLDYCVVQKDFIDKELANVYLYKSQNIFDDFTLQIEEVSGIVKTKLEEFAQLWNGEIDGIEISGYKIDDAGEKKTIQENVSKEKFVPHQVDFYKEVIKKIQAQVV